MLTKAAFQSNLPHYYSMHTPFFPYQKIWTVKLCPLALAFSQNKTHL